MIPVIDLHCDTLSKLSSSPASFRLPPEAAGSHVFLSGLLSSDTLLQCFAVFTDLYNLGEETPLSHVQKQISCFCSFLAESPDVLAPVLTYSDILTNQKQGRISALLSLEESCLSEDILSLLPMLYSKGVRMATLTWNHPNLLGYPASCLTPPGKAASCPPFLSGIRSLHDGLTPLGFDFIEEAERLGILVDVSHLSDTGFYNVAAHSKKPFLASHSNARSICDVPRNLSDDMLRVLAEHGGVAGLNLCEHFLVRNPSSPEELLDALVRHAKHIVSVAGIDTIALGTDFDGIPLNAAIPDVSHLPLLEQALRAAGFSSGGLEKLFYRNALRVFRECL